METLLYWTSLIVVSAFFAIMMYKLRKRHDNGNDETAMFARFFFNIAVGVSIFGLWLISGLIVQFSWPSINTGAMHFIQHGI